ncbi:MAG: hybrid sensor histidine kinase/response regulator [Anaerolineae bacterium]|nr:hybrid sensor histidine kinase/response regulator [Anaerolineae bacterium]
MSSTPSASEETHTKRERAIILFVDDDLAIRESVTDFLRVSGYQVLTAINGADALEILQNQTPDLIIADIAMPEMDGYELYGIVRSNPQWNLLPFVFLTARGEQKDIRYGYSLGIDHYITKPFEPEDLLAVIEARLQRTRVVQETLSSSIEHIKQHLIHTFSHELRSPMTAIYGYVTLLQEDLDKLTDEQVREMLSHVERGTRRLSRLAEDLMLMFQIDSGAVGIEIARFSQFVDIGQLVNNVVQNLVIKAEEHHISIAIDMPDRLLVKGIPLYLTDILTRLIDNAIKFSHREGGHISITGTARDDVCIKIEDTGIGIPPDKQRQLFQRFEQIDRDRLEQQGTGLGLAIAMRLAQMHGGTIDVSSQENVGSTFTLILPSA